MGGNGTDTVREDFLRDSANQCHTQSASFRRSGEKPPPSELLELTQSQLAPNPSPIQRQGGRNHAINPRLNGLTGRLIQILTLHHRSLSIPWWDGVDISHSEQRGYLTWRMRTDESSQGGCKCATIREDRPQSMVNQTKIIFRSCFTCSYTI